MTRIEEFARVLAPKAWDWYGRIGDNRAQSDRRQASLRHARDLFEWFENDGCTVPRTMTVGQMVNDILKEDDEKESA